MQTRRGLGRGLGALIPPPPTAPPRSDEHRGPAAASEPPSTSELAGAGTGAAAGAVAVDDAEAAASDSVAARDPDSRGLLPVDGARYAELPVDQIRPNPHQPREVFDADEMAELVISVREIGVLQPVVVRPSGADSYELVVGERRWRASRDAGLTTVPAIVRETTDQDLLRNALLENLHRAQLNPLEEAAAYRQLLDDFGCSQEELAARIGRSRPQVSNTLRLLRLTPAVQRRVAAGVLSAGHAKALVSLVDPQAQERLAARVVAEGLSVRATEEVVALAGAEPADKRRRGSSARRRRLPEVEERLSERLDTRVRVEAGPARGRMVIEFATTEDLARLLDLVDPPRH